MNNLSNELMKIFHDHVISDRGVKMSISDFFRPLLSKYYEHKGEDAWLKYFFEKNIISKETFMAIYEGISSLPSISVEKLVLGEERDPRGFKRIWCDPDLSRIFSQATVEKDLYPLAGGLVYPCHIFLSALKVNSSIKEIFENQGITYAHLSAIATAYKPKESVTEAINGFLDKFKDALKGRMDNKKDPDDEEDPEFEENEEDEDKNLEDQVKDIAEHILEGMGWPGGDIQDPNSNVKNGSSTPMLDKFSKDLTKEAEFMDPILGREGELRQLYEILGCKKKNNAILIGEAGVGKTALIELLAQKIYRKEAPIEFQEKRIYSLDLNALVAGTKYRGQYEERLKGIIEEVTADKNIIVFIDEIHNLVGNGSSDSSGDAANILKPHLARGTFQCIGSTTYKEYRKTIEKDSALKRRFQNIRIEEPGKKETLNILKGIKKHYEKFHGVTYSKEILELCVDLTERYITDRHFPDKAIDALDLAGSLAGLRNSEEGSDEIQDIRETIEAAKNEKIKAVVDLDWTTAGKAREKEIELTKSLEKINAAKKKISVTDLDVKEAIGKRAGVPIEKLGISDLGKLRNIYQILGKQVLGQEEAIREIVLSLQRNSLGLRDPKKPIASILFVGPTGSGKTYLCKTLAKEFFGREDSLITLNMSEYGERGTISKLLGASASYVGYSEDCALTEVQKKPYSVILFDEIEKAAPEVFQALLSILDEGKITLSNGSEVNFKNTIIIFTGNIGTKDLEIKGKGIGYTNETEDKEAKKNIIVKKAIEKTFSPEFRNRLTKTVIFKNLTPEVMNGICELEIKKLSERLKEKKIAIKVSKDLKSKIISSCDLKFGARDLQRNITKYVEVELCQALLMTNVELGQKKITAELELDNTEKIIVNFK